MNEVNARSMLAESKFYESYSRYRDDLGRFESWNEAVGRVMNMHRQFFDDKMTPELSKIIDEAEDAYCEKLFLGAQRTLQFGGEQILKNNAKLYNCTASYADRPSVFQDAMFLLLSGCGVGLSVLKKYVNKLPEIRDRKKSAKVFKPEDSIEGWADCVGVLMSSYFVGGGTFPEYEGRRVYFDLTDIRPKGAKISGGFLAPGPEPLRIALDKMEYLLQGLVLKGIKRLRPIHVYDLVMFGADAVISGGVRRSATDMIFDADDEEMATAKTGNWFVENPQRGRSNNSTILLRNEVSRERFHSIMEHTRQFGEPGFVWAEDDSIVYNPCFTGDTLVAVADGDYPSITIKELANRKESFNVLSAKFAKGIWQSEPKKAIAFKTGTKKVINVFFADGASFRCTPDHKIALKDGTYIEARLSFGQITTGGKIVGLVDHDEVEDVYDLTVDDNHNFFIDVGSHTVLVHNCFEIGMYPLDVVSGESGFQACNLAEINGSKCSTKEEFFRACRNAAVVCTLQAAYTSFPYLGEATENIVRREALIGVSITGWMNNVKVLFDEETLKEGARIVKETNAYVAKLLGINPAARCTTTKPSGNASVLLQTASGIHPEHAPRYLRNAQMNKETDVAKLIKRQNPYMVEKSVWSANGTDFVVSFPVVAPVGSLYKSDLYGVNMLEKVKFAQKFWVEEGTNLDLCINKTIRHNISNTIVVKDDQWQEVEAFVYDNREYFAGISFLAASGDLDYAQAPFTTVKTEQQIVDEYGSAALFASGLIVDGLKVFSNLWAAIDTARNSELSNKEELDTQSDWIRRFYKFADNYFDGDSKKAEYCLKDVHLLHRWEKIVKNLKPIDFVSELGEKKFVEVDTLAAVACSGGSCEIAW